MNGFKMMFLVLTIFPLTVHSSASSSTSVSVPSKIVNDVSKVQINDVIIMRHQMVPVNGVPTRADLLFKVFATQIEGSDIFRFTGFVWFPVDGGNNVVGNHFIDFVPTNPVIQDRHNSHLFYHTASNAPRRK